MNTITSRTFVLAVVLAFTAYPFVAVISTQLNLNNSALSAAVRTALVALSMIVLLRRPWIKPHATSQWLLLATVVIWAAYMARMAWDTFYRSDQLGQSPEYYWIWALGGCVIPMISLAKQPQRDDVWALAFMGLFVCVSISAILIAITGSGQLQSESGLLYESGRFRIGNTLNPIAVGHVGALLITQAFWYFMFQERSSRRFGAIILAIFAIVGAYILLVGNSRGPLIAAVCCLIVMTIALRARKKASALLVLAAATSLLSPAMLYLEQNTDIAVYSRIFGQSIAGQAESSMRLALYKSALQLAESSPFIGSTFEDPTTRSYPHNIFVELYMATGIFIAAGLVIVCAALCVRSIKLLQQRSKASWSGVLFIQFLVGAQFSSAFYSSTYFWCAVGLVIAAEPLSTARLTSRLLARPPLFSSKQT